MKIVEKKVSLDGTKKYRFMTDDDHFIEACIIYFENRASQGIICISSQLGCESSCVFCNCGNINFIRNLSEAEIYEQIVLILDDEKDLYLMNLEVTYMGTGEPLANIEKVLASIEKIRANHMNVIKFNISTILPTLAIRLDKFLALQDIGHIQYSLHFTDDERRHRYFRKKLPAIEDSLNYLDELSSLMNDKFCINYILFNKINDSIEDAEELCTIVNKHNAYIKISEFTPIKFCDLEPSVNESEFEKVLGDHCVQWKEFKSKGADIQAACGNFLIDRPK